MRKRSALLLFLFTVACITLAPAADKLKPEELVSKNLDSIGPAAARDSLKSMLVTGTAHMHIISGGAGMLDGDTQIASSGDKVHASVKFSNPNYPGEDLTFNGSKVVIGQIRPGSYSKLGTFLNNQIQLIKEGLIDGELSTAWPLYNLKDKNPKLSNNGLKKIDGRELYELRYQPRKGSTDVDIKLYFEPETFHHVMTVYLLTIGARMGSSELTNAQQQETRIRLEERFDDFKPENGLTLPTKWSLHLTSEGGINSGALSANSSIVQWDMLLQDFKLNSDVDSMLGK